MKAADLDRVRRNTADELNLQIDDLIANTIYAYRGASTGELTDRIEELDREWDIERWLETNASSLALGGVALSLAHDRRWLFLTGGVLGFLLLHGVQGWCPPVPVMRRLGVRTRGEIDREKFALKFLRGDFDDVRNARGGIDVDRLVAALGA